VRKAKAGVRQLLSLLLGRKIRPWGISTAVMDIMNCRIVRRGKKMRPFKECNALLTGSGSCLIQDQVNTSFKMLSQKRRKH